VLSSPQENTWLLRGKADDAVLINSMLEQHPDVKGVYSDPQIGVTLTCPESPPLGDEKTVAGLLATEALGANGMDGSGVLVAIVDTGFNLQYLRDKGKQPNFDTSKSWVPTAGLVAGNLPVNHGTMCAYDVLVGAPRATLIDLPVLLSPATGGSVMDGLLSDAVRAYSWLQDVMTGSSPLALIVNNSWGMYRMSWDFPPGAPGRYADNPQHPFNRIVASLERSGADILFAAGNCGRECPSVKCGGITNVGITGANSHSQVPCVGGVDVSKQRVGYSTSGPGLLDRKKPDVCGFTHFVGSGVYPADNGTSAATPVVTGLVAAFRSRFPYVSKDSASYPAAVRNILRKTAEPKGALGFDFDFGWGIVNGPAIAEIKQLVVD
jgi:subtilisin family serine protease